MGRKVSLKRLRLKAWHACSLYVRQFYSDSRGYVICYTCGTSGIRWQESHASHAIPGRTNSVLYDVDIIRPCCVACNLFKGGNLHVFATKLIKEKGLDWWDKKLVQAKQIVKYSRTDYEKLAEDFTLKTQQLSIERRSEKWRKA